MRTLTRFAGTGRDAGFTRTLRPTAPPRLSGSASSRRPAPTRAQARAQGGPSRPRARRGRTCSGAEGGGGRRRCAWAGAAGAGRRDRWRGGAGGTGGGSRRGLRRRSAPEPVVQDFPQLPRERARVTRPPGALGQRLGAQPAQKVLRLRQLDHRRGLQRGKGVTQLRVRQTVRDVQSGQAAAAICGTASAGRDEIQFLRPLRRSSARV